MTTSNHEHANAVGIAFPSLCVLVGFGGLLLWCARTSCHTKSGCDRNTCANSHPRFQLLRRAALCDGVFTGTGVWGLTKRQELIKRLATETARGYRERTTTRRRIE